MEERPIRARMAKLADAADLKSAGAYPPWGFDSPSGHQKQLHTGLTGERLLTF